MMRDPLRRPPLAVFLSAPLLLVLLLGACASQQPPPTAAVRAQFGAMAVVPSPTVRRKVVGEPVKGTGAGIAHGMGVGALGMIAGGASTGNPLGLALGVVLAPGAAVVGGIVGGATARSAKEVNKATAAINAALRDARPHAEIRDRVVARAPKGPAVRLVSKPATAFAPDYTALASEGTDTVLELKAAVTLHGSRNTNPRPALLVAVQGRVVRTRDNAEIYRRAWLYRGDSRSYFAWAKDGARLLRAEIDTAYATLSDKIVYVLFAAPAAEPGTGRSASSAKGVSPGVAPVTGRYCEAGVVAYCQD